MADVMPYVYVLNQYAKNSKAAKFVENHQSIYRKVYIDGASPNHIYAIFKYPLKTGDVKDVPDDLRVLSDKEVKKYMGDSA